MFSVDDEKFPPAGTLQPLNKFGPGIHEGHVIAAFILAGAKLKEIIKISRLPNRTLLAGFVFIGIQVLHDNVKLDLEVIK